MAFTLSDIFIGSFPVTQDFGANPEVYSARYGLKGHNGTDFGLPSGTMVLSAADGIVTESGFDASGYGNYLKITHPDGFLTLYGHLNDKQVNQGDRVVAGQLIGHSNNTGFSDGPHLHFGVAPCDAQGVKTDPNNGYSGYIDAMGADCTWNIKNLSAPINPQDVQPEQMIPVKNSDFVQMVAQGTNYKVIANYAEQQGINHYLASTGQPFIDLQNNPNDASGGQKITEWIGQLLQQVGQLQQQSAQQPADQITQQVAQMTDQQKAGFFSQIASFFQNLVMRPKT